jgi:hypothetical protein
VREVREVEEVEAGRLISAMVVVIARRAKSPA